MYTFIHVWVQYYLYNVWVGYILSIIHLTTEKLIYRRFQLWVKITRVIDC